MLSLILQGFGEEVRHWDVTFWAERLREAKYEISDEQLRPYFSLPNVLQGLFQVRWGSRAVAVEAAKLLKALSGWVQAQGRAAEILLAGASPHWAGPAARVTIWVAASCWQGCRQGMPHSGRRCALQIT